MRSTPINVVGYAAMTQWPIVSNLEQHNYKELTLP